MFICVRLKNSTVHWLCLNKDHFPWNLMYKRLSMRICPFSTRKSANFPMMLYSIHFIHARWYKMGLQAQIHEFLIHLLHASSYKIALQHKNNTPTIWQYNIGNSCCSILLHHSRSCSGTITCSGLDYTKQHHMRHVIYELFFENSKVHFATIFEK